MRGAKKGTAQERAVASAGALVRRFATGLLGVAALAVGLVLPRTAYAEDVKIGILFGVTGEFASFARPLLDAVRLAADEVNSNGGVLNGQKLRTFLGDTMGTPQGGVDAANRLVEADHVSAIVGPNTSLVILAVAHAVAIPKGVLLISPSATAAAITGLEDKDFVFRLAPSDADQGWMLAKLVYARGFTKVAVTYVDNDYGREMNTIFRFNFENYGGSITAAQPHEPNKSNYIPELKALSQYDPQALVVISYAASGGTIIVKQALENGFFRQLIGPHSMMDPLLIKEVGADKLKSMFFTAPSVDPNTSAAKKFDKIYGATFRSARQRLYVAQTYDAVMLTALAIEQAGSSDRNKIPAALRQVCCAPGEVIEPGEWAKAKAEIDAGKKINYEGASGNCDFDENGDIRGVYGHYVIEDGTFKQVELMRPE